MELKLKEEDRFVAFIDVLGFKEILQKNSITEVQRYHDALTLVPFFDANEFDKFILGDAVVISTEVGEKKDLLRNLANLLIAVAIIQQRLAGMNIWTRGAFTRGTVFENDGFFTGPALVKAIALEEDLAEYPRVILDPMIIDDDMRAQFSLQTPGQLADAINMIAIEHEKWGGRVLFDWSTQSFGIDGVGNWQARGNKIEKDVPLFIDYFSTFAGPKPDEMTLGLVIRYLRGRIRDNLKYYKKYRWVAAYLSETLNRNPMKHTTQISLLEQL